ncbi:DNA-binding protein [Spirochaetia bacterium]|nr:DNA-binding protein [Spirochaetia bacterium]
MGANRVFLDTNVLVYIYSDDEALKQNKAKFALTNNKCVINTQVLTEFSNIAFKKLHLSSPEINKIVDTLSNACSVLNVDIAILHKAINIKDRYGYSFYDSLVITSALECGCTYLYSEDMSDGQRIGNLIIRNIFLGAE